MYVAQPRMSLFNFQYAKLYYTGVQLPCQLFSLIKTAPQKGAELTYWHFYYYMQDNFILT